MGRYALVPNDTLMHSGTRANHKYIRKEGDRYIYPDDLTSNNNVRNAVLSSMSSKTNPNRERKPMSSYEELGRQMNAKRERRAEGLRQEQIAREERKKKLEAQRERQNRRQNIYNTVNAISGTFSRAAEGAQRRAEQEGRRRRESNEQVMDNINQTVGRIGNYVNNSINRREEKTSNRRKRQR